MNIASTPEPRAVYVHIPFCSTKCPYCDFNSYPAMEGVHERYVDGLKNEIRRVAESCVPQSRTALDTVYFGGGTPTILTVNQLAKISRAVRDGFGVAQDAEITIEANPGTVDWPMLARLPSSGFNRLSLGVQSFDDEILKAIGRTHTGQQAIGAFRLARQTGWQNVGIDLMFALPDQSISQWRDTLNTAMDLAPEHVSLYELTIEEGTPFARDPRFRRDNEDFDDEGLRLEMYEFAIAHLTESGYEHYEVSNFAAPGLRSRHNQVYWRNEPYYGFGAGATSYINGVRALRKAHPEDYIDAVLNGSDAIESSEQLEPRARLGESVAFGLRILDGIDIRLVQDRTGLDPIVEFASEIELLSQRGLVELHSGRLRVTHQGLLMLNDVAREFVISRQAAP